MIPLDHRDRGNRADPCTEPNSCFSDSSYSLNSLNSMKVPFHLEKTLMFYLLAFVFVGVLFYVELVHRVTPSGE